MGVDDGPIYHTADHTSCRRDRTGPRVSRLPRLTRLNLSLVCDLRNESHGASARGSSTTVRAFCVVSENSSLQGDCSTCGDTVWGEVE